MDPSLAKPRMSVAGTNPEGTNMNKRMSIRPAGNLMNNLGERADPRDASMRSDNPLVSDQTMLADDSVLPGQIDGNNGDTSGPNNQQARRRATTQVNNPTTLNSQASLQDRRMSRAVQFDPNAQSNPDPNQGPSNRKMSRVNQQDPNQQNPGGPMGQAPGMLINGLGRRVTKDAQDMPMQEMPTQGQPTADPMARRATRAYDPNMAQMGMQLGPESRPSMMQPQMGMGGRPSMMQPMMQPQMSMGGRPSMMQPMMQPMMDPYGMNDPYAMNNQATMGMQMGMMGDAPRRKTSRGGNSDDKLPTDLENCREPTKFRCTNCNYTGLSKTEYEPGCYTWVTLCVTCVYCCPFVCCTFALTKWKDAIQTCPDCNRMVNKVEPPDGTLPIVCCWDLCELCAGDGEK